VRTRWHAIALLVLGVVLGAVLRLEYVRAYDPAFDAGVRKVTLIRLDAILYGVIATYACRRWTIRAGTCGALAAGGLAIAAVAVWMLASGRADADPWDARGVLLGDAARARRDATATRRRDRAHGAGPGAASRPVRRTLVVLALPLQPAGAADHDLARRRRHHVARLRGRERGLPRRAVAWAAAKYALVERPIMRAREHVASRLGLVSPAVGRRRRRELNRSLLVAGWSSNSSRRMVGIVVVGHGRLGEEAVHTLQSVVGTIDAFEAVTTSAIERPEEIRARIRDAVSRVRRDRGVLIMTDMLGDTQTNQSIAVARELGAEVVAGVNMPMLVKATDRARRLRRARASPSC
jgi:PTS system mannose-specific IIA component